jgi:hypothetical protein
MITLKQAKAELKPLGITITYKSTWNEYRVNFQQNRGGSEDTAYYTDDREDAVATGREMARELNARLDSPEKFPSLVRAAMQDAADSVDINHK